MCQSDGNRSDESQSTGGHENERKSNIQERDLITSWRTMYRTLTIYTELV